MEELNIERVRAMLHARIGGRGIDADKLYINGVLSLDNPLVTYSETLVWALFLKLQEGEIPCFEGENFGVFSEGYTFDPMYRFKALDFDEINGLASSIAQVFLGESVA